MQAVEDNIAILNRVKQVLKVKTSIEIAEKLGVTNGVVSWYTKKHFSDRKLQKVAEISGCSLFWLITGKGDPYDGEENYGSAVRKKGASKNRFNEVREFPHQELYSGLRDLLIEKGLTRQNEWDKTIPKTSIQTGMSTSVNPEKMVFVIDKKGEDLFFLKKQIEKKHAKVFVFPFSLGSVSLVRNNLPDLLLVRCLVNEISDFFNLFIQQRIGFSIFNSNFNFKNNIPSESIDFFWDILPKDAEISYHFDVLKPYLKIHTFKNKKKKGFHLPDINIVSKVLGYLNLKNEWLVFQFMKG